MEESKPKGPKPLVGRRKRKLYSKVKNQMEFYFSDSNLAKDNFLSSLIQENAQGYVDLEVFKSFNKIRTITTDLGIIVDALSRSNILKVNEDGTKVKRVTAIGAPKDFDACTIYVEKLPPYADHKWIKDVFEHIGVVDFISIPRHKTSKKIKGFAFVEFSNPESVSKACEYYNSEGKVNESEEENNESKSDHARKAEGEGERKAKKRKHNIESTMADKQEQETKDSGTKEENENIEGLSDQKASQTHRKRKMKSEEEIPSKRIHLAVDSSSDQEVEKMYTNEQEKQDYSTAEGEINSEDETPGKSKRKRKHKKKHYQSERLRVMSKHEWKSYRNKYLNLQRSTMSYLKKQIMLETQTWKENEDNIRSETPKKVQFEKGVIIKINLKDPIENATATKDQVKANAVVAYMDAPLGSTDMFVRCHTPEDAVSIIQEEKLQNLGAVELLKGSEEEEYWKKIENDRQVRYKMPPQKKRGRDKLIAKAAKLMEQKNKHIYFDE